MDIPAADLDHLLTKFIINVGKWMTTIMNLTRCRVGSEVYRGSFPKAGPLSHTRAVHQSTSEQILLL